MLTPPVITSALSDMASTLSGILSDMAGVTSSEAGQANTQGNADGFLALLNAVNTSPPPTPPAPVRDTSRDQAQNVVAVPITPSLPPPPAPANNPASENNGNTVQGANQNNGQDNGQQAQNSQSTAQNTSTQNSSTQNTSTQNGSQNANSTQNATPIVPNGGSSQGNENINQAEKQLKAGLQSQFSAIDQILATWIQAVSAGTGSPTSTATQSAATSTSPSVSAQELALLKDMQSLLQQIQQALSGQNTPGQDAQNSQGDNVQTLVASFGSDASQLSQLLKSQPAGSNALTSSLASQLDASITQAKGQVQSLQTANQQWFTSVVSAIQQGLSSASGGSEALTKSLADKGLTVKDITTADASVATNATPATNSMIPPAPSLSNIPVNAASASAAAASLPTGVENGASDTSTDGGGQGQGQNQGASLPVAATAGASSASSAGNDNSVSFARALDQASQASVLDQVTFQIKSAAGDGSSKIHIQLEPADLGKVDIKLDVGADGKTGVTITADNKDTLALLQKDSQGLSRALNDAGLSTDSGSLNFNLRSGQQDQGQGNAQAAMTYQQAQPEDDPVTPVISKSYIITLADGLDITI